MVNLVWDNFENWIDSVAEMIPPPEQDARKKVSKVGKSLEDAYKEKAEADKTVNIEIRENNAEIKVVKMELKKAKSTEHKRREDFWTSIALPTIFVDDLKSQYSLCKKKVKDFQKQHTESKYALAALKAKQGKPEASVVAEIEVLLDNLNIS